MSADILDGVLLVHSVRGMELTLTGQMKYESRDKSAVNKKPKMIVNIHAPTNPSTVFFGDSLINGVLPKVIPQI